MLGRDKDSTGTASREHPAQYGTHRQESSSTCLCKCFQVGTRKHGKAKLTAVPAEPAQDAQLLLCLLHVPAVLQKAVSERAAQQWEARAFLASETQAQGLVGFPAAGASLQGSSQDIHGKLFFLSERRAFSCSFGCLGTLLCMTKLHREALGPERTELANHLNT